MHRVCSHGTNWSIDDAVREGYAQRGMSRGAVLPTWWEGAGSGPVAGRQTTLALVSEGEGYGSMFEIGLAVA